MMRTVFARGQILALLALVLSSIGCGGDSDAPASSAGETTDPEQPDLEVQPVGTLTELEPCELGPAGSSCRVFNVQCPGTAAEGTNVAVRVTPAASTVPRRGTVLFGSGSAGATPYFGVSEAEEPVAWTIGERLRAAGFATIERVWLDQAGGGWFGSDADSLVSASCRLATVVEHIRSELAPSEVFCAVGSSAGSLELSLVMSWFGGSAHLDHVTYVSGPLGRVDLGCTGAWDCGGAIVDYPTTCSPPECSVGELATAIDLLYGEGACAPTSTRLDDLFADSPSRAVSLAEATPADFIWGANDCLGIAVSGREYAESLLAAGARVNRSTITGVGHEVQRDPAGADAIVGTVETSCVARAR